MDIIKSYWFINILISIALLPTFQSCLEGDNSVSSSVVLKKNVTDNVSDQDLYSFTVQAGVVKNAECSVYNIDEQGNRLFEIKKVTTNENGVGVFDLDTAKSFNLNLSVLEIDCNDGIYASESTGEEESLSNENTLSTLVTNQEYEDYNRSIPINILTSIRAEMSKEYKQKDTTWKDIIRTTKEVVEKIFDVEDINIAASNHLNFEGDQTLPLERTC